MDSFYERLFERICKNCPNRQECADTKSHCEQYKKEVTKHENELAECYLQDKYYSYTGHTYGGKLNGTKKGAELCQRKN